MLLPLRKGSIEPASDWFENYASLAHFNNDELRLSAHSEPRMRKEWRLWQIHATVVL